jgi:hypothetical protein
MILPSSVPSVSIFDETTTSAALAPVVMKAASDAAIVNVFSMMFPNPVDFCGTRFDRFHGYF